MPARPALKKKKVRARITKITEDSVTWIYPVGTQIDQVARHMATGATRYKKPVKACFNDIELRAAPGQKAEAVANMYRILLCAKFSTQKVDYSNK